MNELKDISFPFLAGGDDGPDAFAPTHPFVTTRALRNTPINDSVTNFSLGPIVRWLHMRISHELEIAFRGFAFESACQRFCQTMIRWPAHSTQETLFDDVHTSCKSRERVLIVAMQRLEQLFKPIEQLFSPACQRLRCVFSQKPDLSNQMSHAVLYGGIRQSGEFAIAAVIITIQDALKVLAEQFEKNLTTTRFVNVEQRVVQRWKTPCPVLVSVVLMPGFISSQISLETVIPLPLRSIEKGVMI